MQEMGGDVFVREGVEHFRWLNRVGLVDGEDGRHWPLLRRGWVYQEQWLSRRMLHFTKREVVWVCKQGMACECGWYRLEDKRGAEAVEDGGGEQEGDNADEDAEEEKTRPSEWKEIVEEYSERDFTRISDRLPALGGIATVHACCCRDARQVSLWAVGYGPPGRSILAPEKRGAALPEARGCDANLVVGINGRSGPISVR